MFEETLVESRGLVGSGTQRWTALGSLMVQCALVGLLIAIPLLRPEVLRMPGVAPPVAVPFLRKPPVVPVEVRAATSASTAMSLPSAGPATVAAGPSIWPRPGKVTDGTAPAIDTNLRMGSGGPELLSTLGVGSGLSPGVVVARTKDNGPIRVSKGVSEGMLMAPIRPVYPAIAVAARVQGVVVLEAVISKEGRIESLHTVSGPAMLQRAAMDAVSVARYRPYLLSGEPTEVKTTITVVFTLGS